jgi:hypothetical protein
MQVYVYLITTVSGSCISIETMRFVSIPAIRERLFEKEYGGRILARGVKAMYMAAEYGIPMQPPGWS